MLTFFSKFKSIFRWLCIINCAVLYNLIFVVGRAVFWELQNIAPIGWYIVDYGFDLVYLIDIFIRMHEGNFNRVTNCIGQKLPTGNTDLYVLVYDRNRSFGRSFGQFRPNRFGRSFGEGCRITESAKKRHFWAILDNI